MAKQDLNLGAVANDGTGDSLRSAGEKINENFTEVYDAMVPAGGTAGQALVKTTGADFDFDWADVAADGGEGGGSTYANVAYVAAFAEFTTPATPAITRSTNVASVTRTATGRYRITFSSPFPDTDYDVIGTIRYTDDASDAGVALGVDRRAGKGRATTHVDVAAVAVVDPNTAALSDNGAFVRITVLRRQDIVTEAAASVPVELIANLVLGADGTFPVIDTTGFRSVKIVYNLKKSGADGDFSGSSFRFNGVAANYYSKNLYASGGGGAAGDAQVVNGASGSMALLPSVSAGAPRLAAGGVIEFTGLDSALTKGWIDRNISYRVSDGGVFQHQVNGFWDNAAVVTSIALLTSFKAGSSIQVTGIRADAAPSVPNRGFDLRAAGEVTNLAVPTFIGTGIASVVKLSESIFQVNFSSPMPNKDYLVLGSAKYPDAAANQAPVFGLCRNTNLLAGLVGKQLNYVVIDTFQGNGAASAIDSFDIMVGYPVAYTGTSRDGLLGYAFSHTKISGANSAAVEDIPGMSVTFTMPVDGVVELDFDIVIGRASGAVRLFIQLDGVDIVNAEPGQVAYNSIGMAEHTNQILKGKQLYAMTAGVHTLKLRTSAVATTTPADYKDRSMVVRRLA